MLVRQAFQLTPEFLDLSPEAVKKVNGRDALMRVRERPRRTRSTASLPDHVYTTNRIVHSFPPRRVLIHKPGVWNQRSMRSSEKGTDGCRI
jgi:hypothetical protein